ncbi:MAG TPA: RraA family protein [Gaiellaceae bacterium]|jgi:regulator of RNase E activity RraA
MTTQEMIDRYHALSSCVISDSLADLGLPHRGLDGIVTLDLAAKIVGPAFTVQCLPAGESGGQRIEYLREIPNGAVVVIANGGRLDCSVWGGQRTLAARQRGAVGTVVDGAYRDILEHAALSYPVFARGRTIVGSAGMANPVAAQLTVELAGVSVEPGDLIFGDASGVAVIPQASVTAVLEASEAASDEEQRVVTEVTNGRDYFEVKNR